MQVVRIDRDKNAKLNIPRDVFLGIFNTFGLDPYVLCMILRESYGFQRLALEACAVDSKAAQDTFYLKTISCAIIWSHVPACNLTRAIFVTRVSDSVFDASGIFLHFVKTLELQRHLVGHAWLPRFVALIEISRWIEVIFGQALRQLRLAESDTRHGCWEAWERNPVAGQPQSLLDSMHPVSESIGFAASALANVKRHIQIAAELGDIDELAMETTGLAQHLGGLVGSVGDGNASSGIRSTQAALKLILNQVTARTIDVEYLLERVRNQHSVVSLDTRHLVEASGTLHANSSKIFNLINQKDAAASLRIAESAKQDSSSMKVVAMMTLVFLPGTFFATLFAVPSLRWDEDVVVTQQFWIYLAFTMPCTILLLSLYLGQRQFGASWLWRHISNCFSGGIYRVASRGNSSGAGSFMMSHVRV